MPDLDTVVTWLGLVVVAAPTALFCALAVPSILGRPLSEATTGRMVLTAVAAGLTAALSILAMMLTLGTRHVPIVLGEWAHVPHYHLAVKIVFDRLSVPLVVLSFVLCGTIGAFANRYLHRERGYNRFFVLYSLFLVGMVVTSVAGTVEALFAGWELVGLSSALLVAFFQERKAPARNGLRVWVVYRVSDAALLLAAVVMHHLTGGGDLGVLAGVGPWPAGHTPLTSGQAALIGGLLLVAAAGKSALVPFSGWLPRAMEGPTPSSAVFYGALSVHLGAFLLLRIGPVLEASPGLSAAVVALGLLTAGYAYLAGSVQTDIKSALSFASLTQVGIIVAEIGVGAWVPFLRYVALVHLLGHGCLRTLQFIRAPTLLHDYHQLEDAVGAHLERPTAWTKLPAGVRDWLYRFAAERGYLDAILTDYVAGPFVKLFRWFDRLERAWTTALAGGGSRKSGEVKPRRPEVEELV
jgi:NAD(P)H-quinone oxidoreductase subunit 5